MNPFESLPAPLIRSFLGLPGSGEPEDRRVHRPGNGKSHQPAGVVLVVDDSEQDFALVKAAFDHCGSKCELKWARTVNELKAYVEGKAPFADRARHPVPALVLLDIQLDGGGSGFDVLPWLRSRPKPWAQLPVVMLSTSSDRLEIDKSYELGANSYLVKPTGFDEFVAMASELSTYWLRRNRA